MANSKTSINLASAFAGESQAFQKYMFFSKLCKKLGFDDISKLFRDTANQELEHAASHFSLLHPELVIADADILTEDQKKQLVAKCLEMAVAGETEEYTCMYPEMLAQAKLDKDQNATELAKEQIAESKEHAEMFSEANRRFGYLVSIEHHHADQYQKTLDLLLEQKTAGTLGNIEGKYICKKCSLIYDPKFGDIDGGIPAGTSFEDIPHDWVCPICGTSKKMFVPLSSVL